MAKAKRPPHARRSWLFVPGAERAALRSAIDLGADVLIQELEDFTPPERRPQARAFAPAVMSEWHDSPSMAAVRINPLEICGHDDLRAVMAGRPDVVMMAMVSSGEQVRALEAEIDRLETEFGIPGGSTEIVPNIETARGLTRIGEIVGASSRVTGLLLATEDMAADLGATRTPESTELAYVRQRFLVECAAEGVLAIDCPYTYGDARHLEADLAFARMLGFKAKSVVNPDQVAIVNRLLTPSAAEVAHARRVVEMFEAARAAGRDRVDVDGLMIEVPTYRSAMRLLERHAELGRA